MWEAPSDAEEGIWPKAELNCGESVVRELLAQQHPDLALRPIMRAAAGWDNVLWRLGGDPATDLAGAWMLLPMRSIGVPREAYGGIDPELEARALGWSVLFALLFLEIGAGGRADYSEIVHATVRRAVAQSDGLAWARCSGTAHPDGPERGTPKAWREAVCQPGRRTDTHRDDHVGRADGLRLRIPRRTVAQPCATITHESGSGARESPRCSRRRPP